ncbi:hypothetical protein GEMRC1_007732 [Eukaryota sp. GEM-RC1]
MKSKTHDRFYTIMTLIQGATFSSKALLKEAIQEEYLIQKRSFRTTQSTPKRYNVRCQEDGCSWKLSAYALKADSIFIIHSLTLDHSCSGLRTPHSSLTASKIATITPVRTAIQQNLQTNGSTIKTFVASSGVSVNYQNAYRAQKIIKTDLYGTYEESYSELNSYVHELRHSYNEPIIRLEIKAGNFSRVFIWFKELVECYRYCKKLIAIDGCHLYGKYKGVLLTAVCQDGFGHILPICWAIVSGENEDNWTWFFQHLRIALRDLPDDFSLMSDRDKGLIKGAVNVFGEDVPHSFCLVHLKRTLRQNLEVEKSSLI